MGRSSLESCICHPLTVLLTPLRTHQHLYLAYRRRLNYRMVLAYMLGGCIMFVFCHVYAFHAAAFAYNALMVCVDGAYWVYGTIRTLLLGTPIKREPSGRLSIKETVYERNGSFNPHLLGLCSWLVMLRSLLLKPAAPVLAIPRHPSRAAQTLRTPHSSICTPEYDHL